MQIELTNQTGYELTKSDLKLIKRAVVRTKKELKIKQKNVSILLTTNEKIKSYNNRFRKINSPTDCLSFPANDKKYLGDIVISYEKTLEQSEMYGHSFERELAFLIIHSMLHLCGYDHITEKEEKVMRAMQRKILKKTIGELIEE